LADIDVCGMALNSLAVGVSDVPPAAMLRMGSPAARGVGVGSTVSGVGVAVTWAEGCAVKVAVGEPSGVEVGPSASSPSLSPPQAKVNAARASSGAARNRLVMLRS